MRLGKYGKILHFDTVSIGEGSIGRLTFFELKPIGAIILNIFNSIEQNRYHTHAFSAISIMFYGQYLEQILNKDGTSYTRKRHFDIKYLPKNLNHKILQSSKNAMSITLCGPWDETWTETFKDGNVIYYDWGRKKRQ